MTSSKDAELLCVCSNVGAGGGGRKHETNGRRKKVFFSHFPLSRVRPQRIINFFGEKRKLSPPKQTTTNASSLLFSVVEQGGREEGISLEHLSPEEERERATVHCPIEPHQPLTEKEERGRLELVSRNGEKERGRNLLFWEQKRRVVVKGRETFDKCFLGG